VNSLQAATTALQQHLAQPSHRVWAMGLATASLGAMLYVGLYQSRAVRHLWCPVFAKGCEAVADAAFAKPFGIPDGYRSGSVRGDPSPPDGAYNETVDMGTALGALLGCNAGKLPRRSRYGESWELLFLLHADDGSLPGSSFGNMAAALSGVLC